MLRLQQAGPCEEEGWACELPKLDEGAAAPAAVISKVAGGDYVPTAAGIDLDALFVATNAFDQGDEDSLAMIRQLYMKAAEENAAVQRAVVGLASSIRTNLPRRDRLGNGSRDGERSGPR